MKGSLDALIGIAIHRLRTTALRTLQCLSKTQANKGVGTKCHFNHRNSHGSRPREEGFFEVHMEDFDFLIWMGEFDIPPWSPKRNLRE